MLSSGQHKSRIFRLPYHLHKIDDRHILVMPEILFTIAKESLSEEVIMVKNLLNLRLKKPPTFGDLTLNLDGLVTLLKMGV